ncbi:MAG TPA: TRAP transporter permease [Candidatus Competibacteraceae bacterium]|nr:TRAP transporter permease [Candidatus Competibacteraceae bacterium]
MQTQSAASEEELHQLVAAADTGGREVGSIAGAVLATIALAWTLFQLWYASPLPFALGFGVFNDTEARAIHLAFGIFLAYVSYPAFKRAARDRVPLYDWVCALVAAFCTGYLYLFYAELATRPGQPTVLDLWAAGLGVLLLLEATRRAVGTPMTVLAVLFLIYTLVGPYMPEAISHKGASLTRLLTQQWLGTDGVYGVALGVSTSYIFIFVLFGALLDKIGAGDYMMRVSFALLGHLRGGPAKVAVVSSALNGLISGSSVSNVVSGGIFTIPLMKRAGYGGIKAGAIETSSSVNGQIMPPVMGAAAFLMVEYVGIPYVEIIKNAFIPAVISYISLFYIVHLEALRLGIEPMAQAREKTWGQRLTGWALGLSGTVAVCGLIYYVASGVKALAGEAAIWVLGVLLLALYVVLLGYGARYREVTMEDLLGGDGMLPETWATVRNGLHFLIPIVVLIWCLMVELLSPALSAFWATLVLMGMMVLQRPLLALFRRQAFAPACRQGVVELVDGLVYGARNMIGIAVATATAGVIVGVITLTGVGLMMTEFVEVVSGGNLILMLLFTAFVCLVLGLGVPTTANYILVATLMAPVIVDLGAQSGLIIPLIAVHLFVFYYGIMGDITPPVGLATFAAAAISGEDAIKTGIQGSVYALRTVILPFVFIFNPQLLLIDVSGWGEALLVAGAATVASLTFAAATLNYFQVRNRWYETVLLLVATFVLFRPDAIMDRLYPPYESRPPQEIFQVAGSMPANGRLVLRIEGENLEGERIRKIIGLPLEAPSPDGQQRLARIGAQFMDLGGEVEVGAVRFGSRAKKLGLEQGWKVTEVLVPSERPSPHWLYLPGLALVALVYWLQRRRLV